MAKMTQIIIKIPKEKFFQLKIDQNPKKIENIARIELNYLRYQKQL